MLKTIIIDDQEFCTEVIQDIFREEKLNVEVAAVCHSGKEGIRCIKKHQPDLVILDVEMPEMSGFEMLKKIDEPTFDIIFTTSFDKYSIQAIRHSALDFILKPVAAHELKAAVEKAEKQHSKNLTKKFNSLFKNLNDSKKMVERIAIPTMDGLLFVALADIIDCEADSNYTTIFLKNEEKLVITRTLKEVESLLEGNNFFRIHQSHLVNMNQIRKYMRGNPGHVIMNNGKTITIARNRKDDFLEQFLHL
jgi:two-component system, LytTR family, response regulator